jgi:lipopolysaccharide export system permease protein
MLKLQKYILGLLIGPFLAITIGLSLLALLTQSLTQLDLIVERGQSPFTILSISILSTPQFMAVVAPVALFASAILVYGRLYSENELVVAFASGVSVWKIAEPLVRLASVVALFVLFIGVFVQPYTYRLMREKLFAIRSDIATTLVKEGQFRESVKGVTIYTRKIDQNGALRGLLISDTRNKDKSITYSANSGGIVKINGMPAMSLNNGSIHSKDQDGAPLLYGFSQYVITLEGFTANEKDLFYKPADRFTPDLFKPDLTHNWDRANAGELLVEAHHRFSAPFYSIATALLGFFAIFGTGFSRRGQSIHIAKTSAAALAMLLAQSGLEGLIEKQPSLNIIQYLIPIAISLFIMFKLGMFKNWNWLYNSNGAKPKSRKHSGLMELA